MLRVGKKFLLAIALALSAAAQHAKADSIEVASYADGPTAYQWHFDNTAGTLSANTSGTFSSFGPPNQILNFNGSVLTTVMATVNGQASTDSNNITSQAMDGSICFTDPVTKKLVLKVQFTGALISGVNGSRADSLGADELKGQVISYSTNNAFRVGAFNFPSSFIIGLSLEQESGLTITGDNLSTFDATATGTFMTGTTSMFGAPAPTPTPSPESVWGGLSLMGLIGGTGMWIRRRSGRRWG